MATDATAHARVMIVEILIIMGEKKVNNCGRALEDNAFYLFAACTNVWSFRPDVHLNDQLGTNIRPLIVQKTCFNEKW